MSRSRNSNRELKYNIYVNGRIYAAFKSEQMAIDKALAIRANDRRLNVQMETQDGKDYQLAPAWPICEACNGKGYIVSI